MGNHPEKPQPQFDSDPRLNHGSRVQAPDVQGRDEVEGVHQPDLLAHGDVSNDVLPIDPGGTWPNEHQERSSLLPGELPTGPRSMLAPDVGEPGQPICLLNGVPSTRSPSLLLLESPTPRGRVQPPRQKPKPVDEQV